MFIQISRYNNNAGKIVLTNNTGIFRSDYKSISDTFKIINMDHHCGNYSDLHSCKLKTKDGYIMENIWQSCKVYDSVFACKHKKFDTLIWKQDAEKHLDNGIITPAYFEWKDKLIKNKYPVPYPSGFSNRNKYEFLLHNNKKYNLNTGFHEIYIPMYLQLIRNNQRFKELQHQYKSGKNLFIICDNLPYQQSQFKFITRNYVSSGYVLAIALLKELN
jgi:hypothetical protein